jgi:hypothetical protein
LVDLFGNDKGATPNTKNCVDLARRQLALVQERMQRSGAEHQVILKGRLDDARSLAETDLENATAICRGVIELYADKPWARESVEEARALLRDLEMQVAQP